MEPTRSTSNVMRDGLCTVFKPGSPMSSSTRSPFRGRCITGGAVLLLIGVTSCGAGTDAEAPATRNVASKTSWFVDPSPLIRIGVVSGDPLYELGEITAGRMRSDGGIVLADSRTKTLRHYGADGVFRGEWGGEGQGPGEFLFPTQLLLDADDAVTAWDGENWRATRFDAEGRLLEVTTLRYDELLGLLEPNLAPLTAFVLAGGGYLIPMLEVPGISSGKKGAVVKSGPAEPGSLLPRQRMLIVTAIPELAAARGVMELRWEEQVEVASPWGPFQVAPPLGRRPVYAVRPNAPGFCVGDQSETTVACVGPSGALRNLSWSGPVEAVSPDDPEIEAWRERVAAALAEKMGGDVIQEVIDQVPLPTVRPPYGELILDHEGNLWIEQGPSDDGASIEYLVFDRGGSELGSLVMPKGRILEIGEDRILLVTTNELGVQFVRLHSLEKVD